MPRVTVITDSTASLPVSLLERHQMVMVPYYVHLPDRVARDMVDLQPAEFSAYLSSLPDDATLPKTANPGPGDYLQVFVAAAERTAEIISFHISASASGAYQSAVIAREMALQQLRHVRIEVVDTRNVSMCHGWMALQAARAAEQGAGMEEILALVRRMIPVTHMIQTADTLRYLYMGGRIGKAAHLVGSLLNLKPMVTMQEGVIAAVGVARTRPAAYQRMAAWAGSVAGKAARVRLALTHAAAAADAELLLQQMAKVLTPVEVLRLELCPALTVHSGPGTVGACFTPEVA
jgi:DegV family protein with EDD domain